MKYVINQSAKKLKIYPNDKQDYLTLGILHGLGKIDLIVTGVTDSFVEKTEVTHHGEMDLDKLTKLLSS